MCVCVYILDEMLLEEDHRPFCNNDDDDDRNKETNLLHCIHTHHHTHHRRRPQRSIIHRFIKLVVLLSTITTMIIMMTTTRNRGITSSGSSNQKFVSTLIRTIFRTVTEFKNTGNTDRISNSYLFVSSFTIPNNMNHQNYHHHYDHCFCY